MSTDQLPVVPSLAISPALRASIAEQRQDRLDLWAAQAALCIADGRPDLAVLCLDELDCIRRETIVDWGRET